jgi:hypothetical protein
MHVRRVLLLILLALSPCARSLASGAALGLDADSSRSTRRARLGLLGSPRLLHVRFGVEVLVHAGNVIAHVVFAGERSGCALAVGDWAVELLGLVEAVGFLFVASEDGFGGECGAVAVFVAAHVCSQGGL